MDVQNKSCKEKTVNAKERTEIRVTIGKGDRAARFKSCKEKTHGVILLKWFRRKKKKRSEWRRVKRVYLAREVLKRKKSTREKGVEGGIDRCVRCTDLQKRIKRCGESDRGQKRERKTDTIQTG